MSEFIDPIRLLPSASDAEQGVLCSITLDSRYAFEKCAEKSLSGEWFHIPAHATIYGLLWAMYDRSEPIELITVTQALRDSGKLKEVGGAAFVTDLFTFLPTAANVAHYIATMEDKYTLREIIRVGTTFARRGYDEQEEPTALLDEAEAAILAVSKHRHDGNSGGMREITAKEGVMAAIHAIEELYARRGKISGLQTGFRDLDLLIDGLHPEDFVIIGARPSMGKTALMMDIAIHVALEEKVPVAVFSAEMSAEQLFQRAVCSVAKVNQRNVRDGLLTERDFPALTHAACRLAESKLIVIDAVGASITSVRARARRLHRKYKLGLIVVDYLQKLRHPPSAKNREREIAEVSEGLKNINKELKVPILTAAQINRNADARGGESRGIPRLSDLRESGSIEQDADVVMLLNRPVMYADEKDKPALEGVANIEIAKQRNGPLGDVKLTFLNEFVRFESGAPAHESTPAPDPRVKD